MIAMALACNPKLLIADEPTTALDVTIQAQILDLMRELKQKIDAAIVLITHDLGVVAEMAERVVVMYAGRKAEEAPRRAAVPPSAAPLHQGLLASVPRLGVASCRTRRGWPRFPAPCRRSRSRSPAVRSRRAALLRPTSAGTKCRPSKRRSRVTSPPASSRDRVEPSHDVAAAAPLLLGQGAGQAFPGQEAAACSQRTVGQVHRGRRHLASTSPRARRWASSAKAAAASRRRARRSSN